MLEAGSNRCNGLHVENRYKLMKICINIPISHVLRYTLFFSNGRYGCRVNVRRYKYRYFKFTIMNFSEGDIRIIHVQRKHKCTMRTGKHVCF